MTNVKKYASKDVSGQAKSAMIILIGSIKGGIGKSTLAINLAAYLKLQGVDLLLVDGNSTQGTSSGWVEDRETNYPELPPVLCIEKSGNIAKAIKELYSKFECVLVDTGGQDSIEFRSCLAVADVVISPIEASAFALKSFPRTIEVVEEAQLLNPNLRPIVFLNKTHTNPKVPFLNAAREILEAQDVYKVLKNNLPSRTAYEYASYGAGLVDLDSTVKQARNEFLAVVEEIFNGH